MKHKIITVFAIASILAFSVGLRYFPNVWLVVVAVLVLAASFLISTLFKGDTKLIHYVENVHVLRLIFVLVPGLALGLFFTGLTLWGVYLHLVEANLLGSTEIANKYSSGKSMPSGTYSNFILLIGISAFSLFFGSITLFALRSTFKGLGYRFGLKKR
jgi:hypothetical protein